MEYLLYAMADFLQIAKNSVLLTVKAHPGARQSRFNGVVGNSLKIDVAAPPEGGAANRELIAFLAEVFGIAKQRIKVIRGETSRSKVVGIADADIAEIENKILKIIGKE